MHRWMPLLALALGAAPRLAAQDSLPSLPTPEATLSLADAIREARSNSPAYRQTLNNTGPARWGVRNAYGSLLPSFTVSSGVGYTGAGQSQFGAFSNRTTSFVSSNYQLSLFWQLDGRALTAPGQQRALQRATDEEIGEAGNALTADVTFQYLSSLQAVAQVGVARQQVVRNAEFLRLARARFQVGQATMLDVRQAEVTKSRSDVTLLRAEQTANEAKLELLRRMGVEPRVAVDRLALTDTFPVAEPSWQLADLMRMADEGNPALRSLRARQSAAGTNVTAARSEYLPRLTAQAGWSGFTQQFGSSQLLSNNLAQAQQSAAGCADNNLIRTRVGLPANDCFSGNGLDPSGGNLTPAAQQQILDRNQVFPFSYQSQPFQASLTLSLPIFTGFGRNLRVSEARAQQQDAEESTRARALQLHTDVQSRWLALQTSYKAIAVQSSSRVAAREQLRFAQERYRLGSGSSLELSDAENAVQQAEGDYVNAVYDYHKAIAALEAAVGRPLRQ